MNESDTVGPGKLWDVVGSGLGGLLVRNGATLASKAAADRLSVGAVVEGEELKGDRLRFTLRSGDGPSEGWVSFRSSGNLLLVPRDAPEDVLTLLAGAPRKEPLVRKDPPKRPVKKTAAAAPSKQDANQLLVGVPGVNIPPADGFTIYSITCRDVLRYRDPVGSIIMDVDNQFK